MRVIHKYPLHPSSRTTIFPIDGFERVLHVALQNEKIHIWVEKNMSLSGVAWEGPEKEVCNTSIKHLTVFLVGTGQTVPGNTTYVGTVHEGEYVWHCYYK